MRWGLVPRWAKDLKVGYRMINAKAENLDSSRAYAPLVGKFRHRCLIVADGFYEWMVAEDPKQPRQPWRFTVDGGEPFAFAGICTRKEWEDAEDRGFDDGWLYSCTIVTTTPNEVVARVHDRMPAILPSAEAEAAWLRPDLERRGRDRDLRAAARRADAGRPGQPEAEQGRQGDREAPSCSSRRAPRFRARPGPRRRAAVRRVGEQLPRGVGVTQLARAQRLDLAVAVGAEPGGELAGEHPPAAAAVGSAPVAPVQPLGVADQDRHRRRGRRGDRLAGAAEGRGRSVALADEDQRGGSAATTLTTLRQASRGPAAPGRCRGRPRSRRRRGRPASCRSRARRGGQVSRPRTTPVSGAAIRAAMAKPSAAWAGVLERDQDPAAEAVGVACGTGHERLERSTISVATRIETRISTSTALTTD